MDIRALSYVGIETTDVDAWESFGTELLGMPASRPNDDGSRLLLRMDERSYRFDIRKGESDGLRWMGWEMPSAAALDEAVGELVAAGVVTTRGTADESQDRGIVDFVVVQRPGRQSARAVLRPGGRLPAAGPDPADEWLPDR